MNATNEVQLQGDLTVAGASAVLEKLKAAFLERSAVQICFGTVNAVDLTLMQILISARLSAQTLGINFCIAGTIPDAVRQMAQEITMEDVLNQLIEN